MTSISSFSQSLISKESTLNFITAAGSSLLSARFIPVTIKESAIVGGSIAALSSSGNALIGKDASDFKKIIVKTAALALTFYGALSFAPIINARFAVALTPQSITNMLAFHAFGQVVSFALAKTFFVTPWNMSDRQIQKLYAKCEENPEQFKEFSTPEQQLLYRRFIELGLNISKLSPAKPTEEEIAALTDKEVLTLYQHNVFFTEEGSHTLLLRYFELNLNYHIEYSGEIKRLELPMPETTEAVKGLSKEKLGWYKELFDRNDGARAKLPNEVQWAFYQKSCVTNYSFDAESLEHAPCEQIANIMSGASLRWWVGISPKNQPVLAKRAADLGLDKYPVHPTTPEEVKNLSEDVVRAYHSNLISSLSKEVIAAFNRRFYDLNLPLPNGIGTIDKLKKQKDSSYPEIDIPLPKTVSDVNALHDNQLPWVYAACTFSSFSFDVQAALNDRFLPTQGWYYHFTLSQLTAEGIRTVSKENIGRLHNQLKSKLVEWTELPHDVQEALNARFPEAEKEPINLSKVNIEELSEADTKAYHAAFTAQDANWRALPKARQQAFNAAFAKVEGLAQLKVTSWT